MLWGTLLAWLGWGREANLNRSPYHGQLVFVAMERAATSGGQSSLDIRQHVSDDPGPAHTFLILTYEGSRDRMWPRVKEAMPGGFKFLRIYGRGAKQEVQCEMAEAVTHGWRESILPFICQGRLEPDVLEEDWRPWKPDADPEQEKDTSRCVDVVKSMVALFNTAAQRDTSCGLIWYSWEGQEKKKRVPKHGFMAVAKAREMKQAVDAVPGDLGHFDVWMLRWIRNTEPVTSWRLL